MSNKGQSLVEFIVIIAVAVLAGIFVLTLLGGNINQMFTKSSQKVDTYKPFDWGKPSISSNSSSSPNSSSSSTPASTLDVNGINVNMNTDGSASFPYKGQNVVLSAAELNDMGTVIGATGSNGTEILVAMIQDMIDEHKSEYEPNDVPINIMSGKSVRTTESGGESAYGNAEVNLVAVKVGDNYKVYQSDKGGSAAVGDFLIEGTTSDSNANVKNPDGTEVTDLDGFSKDGSSALKSVKTYEDPATGKFYIIGEGPDGAERAGNDIPSEANIVPPDGLLALVPHCFDNGKPRDKVWIMEFNPDE